MPRSGSSGEIANGAPCAYGMPMTSMDVASANATASQDRATSPQASAPGPGRVARDGFVQIRVAGTPSEMGEQHGELLRDEIRDLLEAVRHHVLQGQPGVIGWGIRRAVDAATAMMGTQVPQRYREEMAGVARAAGVSFRDILMVACFDDLLANLRMLGALFGRLGCSTFALTADRTASRELVCGRNLDYFVASAVADDSWAATNYMKEHLAVIEYQPRNRASFVSITWPGFVGAVTAMSQRGMVAASMTVATVKNSPLATPSPFLYRRIMEETGSLDEAIGILRGARRTQGNNVLLGSAAEGTAAIVEYTPWRLVVRLPVEGWVASTNHFNDPEMARHHANLVFLSSRERLARLGELCADHGSTAEVQEIRGFLTDLERRSPEATEYCTLLNPCTIYSAFFQPAQRRMWVRAADRPGRTFQEIGVARG